MKISQIVMLAFMTGTTMLAQAAVVDNFDSYPVLLNWTPPVISGWTVTNGTVDLIGFTNNVHYFDFIPGNGGYVDLDGSTNQSGLLSHSFNLIGGTQYTLSFDLAGSHRGGTETVDVTFGGVLGNYFLNSNDDFSLKTLNFTPDSSGVYSISFQNQGGDNMGALLDNVSVTAVPEPEVYGMMLMGLGLMGFVARRRKNK
jgi:hypothetical protein